MKLHFITLEQIHKFHSSAVPPQRAESDARKEISDRPQEIVAPFIIKNIYKDATMFFALI